MARLTLRVPDSLHASLAERARQEGVSMNQYLVFALSRIATADDIASQQARFNEMLACYPKVEAEVALQTVLQDRL